MNPRSRRGWALAPKRPSRPRTPLLHGGAGLPGMACPRLPPPHTSSRHLTLLQATRHPRGLSRSPKPPPPLTSPSRPVQGEVLVQRCPAKAAACEQRGDRGELCPRASLNRRASRSYGRCPAAVGSHGGEGLLLSDAVSTMQWKHCRFEQKGSEAAHNEKWALDPQNPAGRKQTEKTRLRNTCPSTERERR